MKIGLIIAIFVAVAGLVLGLYIRRRNMTFDGTVTDKDIREEAVNNNINQTQSSGINFGNTGGVRHVYTIKVQTDAGKSINWQVSEGKYQIINIGDRVVKRSGTTELDVTPKVQTTPLPTQPTPPAPPSNIVSN